MAFTNVDKFPDGTQTARDSSYFENSLTLQYGNCLQKIIGIKAES